MDWSIRFFITSAMLGVGLAMDAFSVSLANGLNEPGMSRKKMAGIAGMFAFFQALMPLIGWFCVHTITNLFQSVEKFIPLIALLLLLFIGIKMIMDGIQGEEESEEKAGLGFGALLVQGIATSIDALSVGFTIAEYNGVMAVVSALIIAAVTFVICAFGLVLGRTAGTKLAGKAQILGGAILILIGLEIFITGFF